MYFKENQSTSPEMERPVQEGQPNFLLPIYSQRGSESMDLL